MHTWTIEDAKARLSELIDRAKEIGPQTIIKNGCPAAVVVSTEEWERKSRREGTVSQFFAKSPLAGSGVKIERLKDRLPMRTAESMVKQQVAENCS